MTGSPYLDDQGEILVMCRTLAEVGYRDLSTYANQRRLAVARRLFREGITDRLLRMLWAYAQACGNNPTRLFAWWLDRPAVAVKKCNEMRERDGWARRAASKEVRLEAERDVGAVIRDIGEARRAQ